jgi:hypothetical protein
LLPSRAAPLPGRELATTADDRLADIRSDNELRAAEPPSLDQVLEDVGLQRLAAYYLFSALIAGLISDDLAAARWPQEFADPMQRLGLRRLAPRTRRALDAELTTAEQATLRSVHREQEFGKLLVEMINLGAFGPLCGNADSVRLAGPADDGLDLELIKDGSAVGRCKAKAHWELVAQRLAGAMQDQDSLASAAHPSKAASWLKETGISHAVSAGVTLAVSVHPLGAAAGLGTRVIRSRIQAGHEQADALHRLGEQLRTERAQASSELTNLQAAGR